MDSASKLRILVLGYVVRRPLGGGTWPTLQYALGLQRLGHDVWFVEDSEDWPACYDPSRHVTDEDPSFGLAYAGEVFERTGLADRWAYFDAHRGNWHGPLGDDAAATLEQADLLLNVSGVNPIRPWLAEVPHRAWIDTDPAFEQVRQLTDNHRRDRARQHNVFFTYGENIPGGDALVPDDGLPWQTSRQPVVLDRWQPTPPPADGKFTTVMLWDSYPARDHAGFHFGMKSESFDPYLDLPRQAPPGVTLELALGGEDAPRTRLREHGWTLVNPLGPTRDPWTYQRYLSDSLGEFTVAKHGYVASRSGWFSERSAHYLASGRPVITQDTAFQTWLPTGEGLFAFADLEAAIAALAEVRSDPARHGAAARRLAEDHFDSDRVLTRLIDLAMQPPTEVSP